MHPTAYNWGSLSKTVAKLQDDYVFYTPEGGMIPPQYRAIKAAVKKHGYVDGRLAWNEPWDKGRSWSQFWMMSRGFASNPPNKIELHEDGTVYSR